MYNTVSELFVFEISSNSNKLVEKAITQIQSTFSQVRDCLSGNPEAFHGNLYPRFVTSQKIRKSGHRIMRRTTFNLHSAKAKGRIIDQSNVVNLDELN